MNRRGFHRLGALCSLSGLLLAGACKPRPTDIVVFYASSLSAVLGDASEAFEKVNPRYRLRLEPSGSQVAARKVSELGMRADIVAVADAKLIERIMIPAHAAWAVVFATNEMVIAHKDHSKYTDQIGTENWPEILARPGVRLGRVDPDTAPLGYHTLVVWQLAERSGLYGAAAAGLSGRLARQCSKEHVVQDEADLLALLESRAIDYAFLFRSTAEDHHLKIVTLPPEINLSREDFDSRYAAASVEVRMRQGQEGARVSGSAIAYGLTIPVNAPHPRAAALFAGFLVGDSGRRLLERRGFHPLRRARCSPCAGIPAGLSGRLGASSAGVP